MGFYRGYGRWIPLFKVSGEEWVVNWGDAQSGGPNGTESASALQGRRTPICLAEEPSVIYLVHL